LRKLLETLAAAPAPVEVFFRDDDAGWEDKRLLSLCDLFGAHGLPLDLAVIPTAASPGLARELRRRDWLGLHQHGYAHANHEREGRKCEFGPSRSYEEVRADVWAGRERLRELLGDAVQPVFTPPWNRCTADTARAVLDLGFAVLSREHRAEPFGLDGLAERPVHLDFARLTPEELDDRFASQVRAGGPVGVMFHHAVMEREDFDRAASLLGELARHERVRPRPLLRPA
jgi:uncharacterized protein DUF2334